MVPVAPVDEDDCLFADISRLPSHSFEREGSGFSTIIVGFLRHEIKSKVGIFERSGTSKLQENYCYFKAIIHSCHNLQIQTKTKITLFSGLPSQ